MRGDGRGKRRILADNAFGSWIANPAWAPGGQRIAFGAYGKLPGTTDYGQVWIYNVATGATRQLTRLTFGNDPSLDVSSVASIGWSPRGNRIAFQWTTLSGTMDVRHVYVFTIAPDGSHLRQLTSSGRSGEPAWAPGGTRLVTTVGFPGNGRENPDAHQLVIRRLDGSVVRDIRVPRALDPAWAPDGRWIAYSQLPTDVGLYPSTPKPGLWLTRPNGRDAHRILATRHAPHSIVTIDWQPLRPK
jgi:Tol biopolymer transport system component